jgi:hypothetical protein
VPVAPQREQKHSQYSDTSFVSLVFSAWSMFIGCRPGLFLCDGVSEGGTVVCWPLPGPWGEASAVSGAECSLQWAVRCGCRAAAVAGEQLFGFLGQHAADFAAFAFDAGDVHGVIGGGLVPQPGDDGGFRATFDRDHFGASDGAAADGCGVSGDSVGQFAGQFQVVGVEVEEVEDGGSEIFDVGRLCFLTTAGVGDFAFGEGRGGAFAFELLADGLDGVCCRPDSQ